jgi:hypothetical protein
MGIREDADKWREKMLAHLVESSDNGANKVEWYTAQDEHVCPLCVARNRKIYTFEQAKKELEGEFCKPSDPDDRCRCRCCFLTVVK